MLFMRKAMIAFVLALIAACAPPQATAPSAPPVAANSTSSPPVRVPAGDYTLDKPHASLIVRLSHLGFSHFTAHFTRWDGHLHFDPANPALSNILVSIDPSSIESDNPPEHFLDTMRGAQFLNASHFPEIAFRSTGVERTGATTARVTGDLTLHGVTKPVTLEARFNGGYEGVQGLDPHARVGFSAHGSFRRSEFGMGYGIPPAGSNFGVGDLVEVIIESEFAGPAMAAHPSP